MTYNIQVFNPDLASIIGLEESIVLQQMQYWLERCGRTVNDSDQNWIYNSIENWHKQFSYWSKSKIRRIISSLENKGFITSQKINAEKWNQTKWYTVNFEKLNLLCKPAENQIKKISSKRTNRFAQNEQMYNTEINYTDISSSIEQTIHEEENFSLDVDTLENSYLEKNIINYDVKIMTEESSEIIVTEKKAIVEAMVQEWNEIFKYALQPIKAYYNAQNQNKLYWLWKTVFSEDMNQWKEYCCKVNSSKFLMGEKVTKNNFKATFSWLTKKETVSKIMVGEYGVGDRELDKNNISKNIEKCQDLVIKKTNQKIINHIKNNILKEQEEAMFRSYIAQEKYLEDSDPYELKHLLYNNCAIGKHGFLRDDRFKTLYKSKLDSYITKRHIGTTSGEAKTLIQKLVTKLSSECSGFNLLKRLKKAEDMVDNTRLGEGEPLQLLGVL